jgi:hypothetical protein
MPGVPLDALIVAETLDLTEVLSSIRPSPLDQALVTRFSLIPSHT